MRILVIEDDKVAAEYVRKGLMEAGHVIDIANDGDLGLEMARASNYDVLVIDRMLPKMNGLDFIRELKNRDINLPVIVITAYDTKEHLKECEELEVDEVIIKPVNFLELFNKIEIICSK